MKWIIKLRVIIKIFKRINNSNELKVPQTINQHFNHFRYKTWYIEKYTKFRLSNYKTAKF